MCEKASLTIDTQTEQYGNFMKKGGGGGLGGGARPVNFDIDFPSFCKCYCLKYCTHLKDKETLHNRHFSLLNVNVAGACG